jgi:hypothetical protein
MNPQLGCIKIPHKKTLILMQIKLLTDEKLWRYGGYSLGLSVLQQQLSQGLICVNCVLLNKYCYSTSSPDFLWTFFLPCCCTWTDLLHTDRSILTLLKHSFLLSSYKCPRTPCHTNFATSRSDIKMNGV